MLMARLLGLLLLCLAVSGCNTLFYFPARGWYEYPQSRPEPLSVTTADGVTLDGWIFPARGETRGTLIQFHGNAGNISTHYDSLAWVTAYGYRFVTFDWRGYGHSTGEPTPAGVEADALAIMGWSQGLPQGACDRDLVYYGQSLGGAVLMHAYASFHERRRVETLIVEGTFHSYEEVAAGVFWRTPILFPFTGFAYALVSDDYAPERIMPRIASTPLLVIHGDRDPVVPPAYGRAVFRTAQGEKEFWLVPGGKHANSMRYAAWRKRLIEHLDRGCRVGPLTGRYADHKMQSGSRFRDPD
jgi:fermentation-respiration switch protein FrsA (DUF1100 family)